MQQSSDTWLNDGTPHGPSSSQAVMWNVGISARISDEYNDMAAAVNGSNLPFNTRAAAATEGETQLASSTLFCLDLSASNLQADGALESLAQFDIIAYDHFADLGNGAYSGAAANDTGINFTNDFRIARGKDRDCSLDTVTQGAETIGAGTGSLTKYTKSLSLEHACRQGNNYLPSFVEEGSLLRINGLVPGFGFEETGARFTVLGQPAGVAVGNPGSAITINGVPLFTELDLFWTGSSLNLTDAPMTLELEFQYDALAVPQFQLELQLLLVATIGEQDETPYDGDDQFSHCTPQPFPVNGQMLEVDPPSL